MRHASTYSIVMNRVFLIVASAMKTWVHAVPSLITLPLTGFAIAVVVAVGQTRPAAVNYDESKVPRYTLPDPLVMRDGRKVADARTWTDERRPEILELFRTCMYGRSPERPRGMIFRVLGTDRRAIAGTATRKTIAVNLTGPAEGPVMRLVLYLPNAATRPVPVFVGIHLFDTRAEYPMPGVPLSQEERRGTAAGGPASRPSGVAAGGLPGRRLPEVILQRGYAFATIDAAGLAPDSRTDFEKGVIGCFRKSGRTKRVPDEWGAIGAWAWGLSRAVDYFETDPEVDSKRVIAIGHSRMGKTALWAGAQDGRFAMVISNDSGCGGAALSRRCFGETVEIINTAFPHWFCEDFRKYNRREDDLPVDQHMLIALIAPRPVYVASAEKDLWADPRGEFLAARHADPVYRLLGTDGLAVQEQPGLGQPVLSTIGYHIRRGKHDLTDYDWTCYLEFADKHLGRGNR
jgi:hypothetical protein